MGFARQSSLMAYREVPCQYKVRQEGDCFARYKVRIEEMTKVFACRVAIDKMPGGAICTRTPIALRPPRGETYFALESSKGELGVYFISDGGDIPGAPNCAAHPCQPQILPEMLRGHKMSDRSHSGQHRYRTWAKLTR